MLHLLHLAQLRIVLFHITENVNADVIVCFYCLLNDQADLNHQACLLETETFTLTGPLANKLIFLQPTETFNPHASTTLPVTLMKLTTDPKEAFESKEHGNHV